MAHWEVACSTFCIVDDGSFDITSIGLGNEEQGALIISSVGAMLERNERGGR